MASEDPKGSSSTSGLNSGISGLQLLDQVSKSKHSFDIVDRQQTATTGSGNLTPYVSFSDTSLSLTQEINSLPESSFLASKNYLENSEEIVDISSKQTERSNKRKLGEKVLEIFQDHNFFQMQKRIH